MIEVLFQHPGTAAPDVSLVLLDWCVRESFHSLDYLARQTVPRSRYEVLWIEYYDRVAPDIRLKIDTAVSAGAPPVVDAWLRMNMPREAYYHKHLMYNVGIALAAGRIVIICDSDAMMRETFIESVIRAFDDNPGLVLHLDELRNVERRFYPFNAPSFADLESGECINWRDGKTTGIVDRQDPLHSLNYGACFCARRDDLIAIGGADEHLDYLGHVCGPYELTWRLVNAGRTEQWHQSEFLYHTWHPGTDGDENYLGPHDGRNLSTTALAARRTRRVLPLVENRVIAMLRQSPASVGDSAAWLPQVVDEGVLQTWRIDEIKRTVAAGRAAYGRKHFDEAIASWERVRPSMVQDSMFWSDLGWAYYLRERHDDAIAAFDRALEIDHDNPFALQRRGWTHRHQRQFNLAIADFTRALDLIDPLDFQSREGAYRGRGWSRFHAKQFDLAVEDFAHAVEFTTERTRGTLQDLYRGLGWAHFRLNDPRAAQSWFTRALEVAAPDDMAAREDALKGLGRVAPLLGDGAQAAGAPAVAGRPVDLVKKAEALPVGPSASEPEVQSGVALKSDLVSRLGWALQYKNLHSDALPMFDEALGLDAANRSAESGRGWSLLHLHRYDEAVGQFDALIARLEPSERRVRQEAMRGRAWAHYRGGRFRQAIEDFSTALQSTAEHDHRVREEILRGRGRAYYRLGQRAQARRDAAGRYGQLNVSSLRLATDIVGSVVAHRFRRLFS